MSGVYAVMMQNRDSVCVFNDELGQYPIFYNLNSNRFCILNDAFEVAKYTDLTLDQESVVDGLTCFTYIGDKR